MTSGTDTDACWLQVQVDTAEGAVEAVEALLSAWGAQSITLGDAGDEPLLEPPPGKIPIWRQTRVTGLFAAADLRARQHETLFALLGEIGGARAARIETLANQPWESMWLEHFKPMAFGPRLWVIPDDRPPPDRGAVNLRLEPGLAFGTGTHPTTALCLTWLASQPLDGRTLVDFGCGSGILAVAAALLGADRIFAVDHDPQALIATQANAERNGVRGRIDILSPRQWSDISAAGTADVVIANILANTLIELAPGLTALLAPHGRLALSGVLPAQADNVIAAFQPSLRFAEPLIREDWALLIGQRVP